MAELNVAPAAAAAQPATEPVGRITRVVVRLEVDAEAARVLLHAAELAGSPQRLILTYEGEPLGEVVPVADAGVLARLRNRLSLTVANIAAAPAGAVGPEVLLPDAGWQQEWEALQSRARSELPEGMTPEEIETEIDRAAVQLRSERIAQRS